MCMCMRACLCARNLTLSVMKKKKILKGACVRVCVCACVRACVRVGVFAHFKHVVLEHVGSPAFGCR